MFWDEGIGVMQRWMFVVVCLLMVFVVAGCGASSPSDSIGQAGFYTHGTAGGTPVRGGTVIIDSPGPAATLDPADAEGNPNEDRAYEALYDTLVETMPGSNGPQPALATSWSVSSDKLVYTFNIRHGVRFSNGEPLTGEDVVYTLRRMAGLSGYAGVVAKQFFKKVSLAGPMRVQLQLSKPYPVLVEVLSVPVFSVVPKNVAGRESEQQFAQHPVGTGPFMLKSASAGNTTVTMVRNPHYWRAGQPYLDGLVMNSVENSSARILAVRSGAATIAVGVPYALAPGLQKVSGAKMLIEPLWGAGLNAINNTAAPLNEANVRRALMYATPFSAIIKSVYKGLATQATDAWGKMKYWDPRVPAYTYDPAKAKELLKSTSVPHGFSVTIDCQGGETTGELTASILQSAWAHIGVQVTVHTSDYATLGADLGDGKYQVMLLPPEGGVNEEFDPSGAIEAYFGGASIPSIAPSARLKALIAKMSTVTEEPARQKLFNEIQEVTYLTEPSWMAIVDLGSFNLVSDSLRGYQVLPSGHSRMEQMWLAAG